LLFLCSKKFIFMKRFIRNIILIFNVLAALSICISYISVYVNPAVSVLPAFLGLAYPVVLVVNIAFVIFWLMMKKWWALVSLGAIVVGWQTMSAFFQFNFDKPVEQHSEEAFKVLSYNVRLFDLYGWSKNTDTRGNIFEFIEMEDADIMCFQEYYSNPEKNLNITDTIVNKQKADFSHVVFANAEGKQYHFGVATFSFFPIVNKKEIQFENSNSICIISDLKINDDTVRVFNAHLQSVKFGFTDYNFIDSIELKDEQQQIHGVFQILRKLKAAYIIRAEQAKIIAAEINNSPYEVIVCGDFNDTPVSYVYRTIKGELTDAFIETGWGVGNTYNGLLPALRIDYILHSNKLVSYNFRKTNVKYSDHFPVITWFHFL